MKTTKLFDRWQGMAPDKPRDAMDRGQVWLMKNWIPRVLGSQLESRNDWRYSTHGPLNGPVVAQEYVQTYGSPHYLVATPTRIYDLDVRESPDILLSSTTGLLNPFASLFNVVCMPRVDDNLPIFLHYAVGAANPTVQTTPATVPKCKHAEAWNDYFMLANTQANPGRVHWYGPIGETGAVDPWDSKMWQDTISDVTGLARTRTSMLIFHADGAERLRGAIPPSSTGEGDIWREPLSGLGGCTAPHTITYWNDNVLFADGRGAYMTDGTQIKDLTVQGGISRDWQRTYTSSIRLAAGIFSNFWVCTFTQPTGEFVSCWVYDLTERGWFFFDNIPAISFVTTFDEREKLYGGTYDGKVIDLARMWDDSDATVDTIDENAVSVLPQLETAWYRMSDEEAIKRINQGHVSFDLAETTGHMKVYFSKQVQPASGEWILGKEYRQTDQAGLIPADQRYKIRPFDVGRESPGFAFKLETTGALRNLKLYNLAVEGPGAREGSYR